MKINLTISINDEKVDEYKQAILRAYPVPAREEISENEWLFKIARELTVGAFKTAYNRGRDLLARDNQSSAEDVIGD